MRHDSSGAFADLEDIECNAPDRLRQGGDAPGETLGRVADPHVAAAKFAATAAGIPVP